MSTEIETSMQHHTALRFWGGDERGVCMQISTTHPKDGESHIQLTMEEAAALCQTLVPFISEEAKRRQGLLAEFVKRHKEAEKTVFAEIRDLPSSLMVSCMATTVDLISRFCPKS